MSRALILIRTNADRYRASAWALNAPFGTRVEFKETKRSNEQNAALWAMLTEVAAQATHCGRKYSADVWKVLFLNGWQRELNLIPTLDGTGLLPISRTSDLSRKEMGDLLDFIDAWAAQNGIKLSGPHEVKDAGQAA